jgi:hypothetical protein
LETADCKTESLTSSTRDEGVFTLLTPTDYFYAGLSYVCDKVCVPCC